MLGYAISIGSFAVLFHVAGTSPVVAATGAFCLALANNFYWNRHWTFRAGDGHAGFQATRFVAHQHRRLHLQPRGPAPHDRRGRAAAVASQAIAVLAAAPPNYVAHRIWSFRV